MKLIFMVKLYVENLLRFLAIGGQGLKKSFDLGQI